MALILSIETATNICSVAIHNDGHPVGSQSLFKSQSHSGLLVPVIDNLVRHCGINLEDLNAVSVSEGPGSYTGLRIGVSTAKGLCDALDIPLISVNTLMALANGVSNMIPDKALLCPMLDARRMEVYAMLCHKDLKVISEIAPKIINEDSYREVLKENKIYFFGNGSAKCATLINHKNAFFLESINNNAMFMGDLAYSKFLNNDFEDLAYFEPFYLKEFRTTKPKSKE